MLAHELRSPLSAIGNAARLIDPAGKAENRCWAKEVIERQVSHLARLIDGLLDVSRIAEGKIRLRKERIDVSTIVGRAAETAGGLIDERRHQLDVSIASGPLRLDADPTRLEQVLVNLLNNAAKYTPEGGRIWLTAGPRGRRSSSRCATPASGSLPNCSRGSTTPSCRTSARSNSPGAGSGSACRW